MTQLTTVFVAILVVAAISNSGAMLVGGKCSTSGYMQSISSCIYKYNQDFSKALITGLPSPSSYIKTMIDYQTKACKSGLMTKIADCVDEVHKMCDFSIISTPTFRSISDLLCLNIQGISNLGFFNIDYSAMATCFTTVTLNATNPICSATTALKTCVEDSIKLSSPQFKQIASDILGNISARICNETDEVSGGGKCSLTTYSLTSSVCYASYYSKLVAKIRLNRPNTLADEIRLACGMPELSEALTCHENVDNTCGLSIIDVPKLRTLVSSTCAANQDLISLRTCFSFTNKTIPCVARAVAKSHSVCSLEMSLRDCFRPLVANCVAPVKLVMQDFYKLFVPNSCASHTVKKCAELPYIANLFMCWAPSVSAAASPYFPRDIFVFAKAVDRMTPVRFKRLYSFMDQLYLDLGFNTCNDTVLTRAKRCHQRLDTQCGGSLASPEAIYTILKVVCDDPLAFLKYTSCYQNNAHAFIKPCPAADLLKRPVTTQAKLCKLMKSVGKCSLRMFRGKGCDRMVAITIKKVARLSTAIPCLSSTDS